MCVLFLGDDMAKEWAKDFYQSINWKKTRDYILAKNYYLCQKCKNKPAEIVHHIIWLTPSNINDPKTTLGEDNLTPVCRECHAIIHEGVDATTEGLMFNADGELIRR